MGFCFLLYLLQCREVVKLAHNALATLPVAIYHHKIEAYPFKLEALIVVEDAVLGVQLATLYLSFEVLMPEALQRLARPRQRVLRQLFLYFFACHFLLPSSIALIRAFLWYSTQASIALARSL